MENENLKLRYHDGTPFIESPSGKKITASKLEVGKTYLHQNFHFLRMIVALNETLVFYTEEFGPGYCSKTHFATICPYEATDEEIEFLTTKQRY